MPPAPRIRLGFTLLEVIIASAILVTVMGLIMQSMVSSVHLTSLGYAEDDVAIDGNAVIARYVDREAVFL